MTTSSSPTLRIGILGAANIARLFAAGVRASQSVSVAAIAARDAGRAQVFADEVGIACVHPTYEALLADPTIDTVYNPLPNSLHAQWSIRALDAGIKAAGVEGVPAYLLDGQFFFSGSQDVAGYVQRLTGVAQAA